MNPAKQTDQVGRVAPRAPSDEASTVTPLHGAPRVERIDTPSRFKITIQGETFVLDYATASEIQVSLTRSLAACPSARPRPAIEGDALHVCRIVGEEFGVAVSAMRGTRRTQLVADARAWAMMLLYSDAVRAFTTVAIAEWFHRDHGTVCHSCRKVEDQVATEPAAKARLARLRNKLSNALQSP